MPFGQWYSPTASLRSKYNITETKGFNNTFDLSKIALQRSWNITWNLSSKPFGSSRKKTSNGCLFSVIFAYGKLYCCAVIFGLRRVILCFAEFKGKYNITETKGFNNTFDLSKISLHRRWNITWNLSSEPFITPMIKVIHSDVFF